ncbi:MULTISPECIES: dienelactone hydrolase family protein [Rhizobium]|uniref:Dienelactone hydrolase n=1 Tax=Rhizobium favelukesii TaxID=348824 RepID=W6RL19_9HYPH|nr:MULTISPECIES: dienelactone hydrolase family protein [Rhizobium]MCS0461026.1 dienelactone hydrolase family protein [Rhizobium favelukesii]UFS85624.1 dienelactone hydrolase family protein [Rhizobium sp. T136]CDM60950.1 dienelactone hydrolase [Rhizobium favelukesii]
MARFIGAALTLFILTLFASQGHAGEVRPKFPPDERLNVPSLTLTDEQFLEGDTANGVAVTLTGELRFPSWDEHLPAVILLHGSNGVKSGSASRWAEFLNRMGIATFRLDSFGGRGIDQVETDQSRLSPFAQFYDTYRAVDVLAAHPRIDPSRIAVIGFSRGGSAALYTSMRRFQALHGPTKARIAAHLSFYPACNIHFVDELDIADAPVREFHGAADDTTLAATCLDYITRLNAAGKDAVMTEYPGAHHGFDNPDARFVSVIQSAQSSRNCQRREEDGKVLNVETGKPFTFNDACVELGSTVGYDKAATEAAQATVKRFLTGVFRPN